MVIGDVIGDGMAGLELREVAGLGGGEVMVFLLAQRPFTLVLMMINSSSYCLLIIL